LIKKKVLEDFPRIKLICRPTPLYRLENLTRVLGGPQILIKRDDLTGLAFGGNKSRKLEFILADAMNKGTDTIITWGSLQSNWCLQLAAASKKTGLKPVLVLFQTYNLPFSYDGNILLEHLLEARIVVRETEISGKSIPPEVAFQMLQEVAQEEVAQGRKPYLVAVGGSIVGGDMDRPLGALAYFETAQEIAAQTGDSNLVPDWIVIASGSGATQAGLLVGARALGLKSRVIGICVSEPEEKFRPQVREIAERLIKILNLDLEIPKEEIILYDDYLGSGYGQITEEVSSTIRYILQTEGLVLDPVYTAKAMVGLIDLVRKGAFKPSEKVLFVHTGGTPALFAFRDRLIRPTA